MADDLTPTKGRDWGWKPYIFLILILALFYLPYPNRHPQFDGVAYLVNAQQANWQGRLLLPANHVLPEPFFRLMSQLQKALGNPVDLARFFSICDSLIMIVALLILLGFYKRLLGRDAPAFLAVLALGSCFAVWYFATDIENVALVMLGASLLLNIGWRSGHPNSILRGFLLGLLAVFATLCMQTLAVLSIFTAIYLFRRKKTRLACSYSIFYSLLLLAIYLLVAFAYSGINSVEHFKNYLLGYAEISHAQSQGWMNLSWNTPFAAIVGFSRSILGLHPLMNIPWLKELALRGLPGNVITNQIAMAEGITPWLQIPLIITTILLLLSLPLFVWFAWRGRINGDDAKEITIDRGLMVFYAATMALLTIIWLPQGGEFWLMVLVILIPHAMHHLTRLAPLLQKMAICWIGLLAFTNLFGSISPFADETVDPTLPSILYLNEIRQPDDLYLIPYSAAYPQRWVFGWVIPVNNIGTGSNATDNPWEKEIVSGNGMIYFSSDLYNLKPQEKLNFKDIAFNLSSVEWKYISSNASHFHTIGALEIMAVKR